MSRLVYCSTRWSEEQDALVLWYRLLPGPIDVLVLQLHLVLDRSSGKSITSPWRYVGMLATLERAYHHIMKA